MLTASCIWSSFQNSGKRHIILTGSRNSGKTTLLNELFPEKVCGITTWAEPKKAVYLKDNISSETVKVGAFEASLDVNENRMLLCDDGFEVFGSKVLNECIENDSEWVTIDEIGYLESACDEYIKSLNRLFDNKHVAAVVRKQSLPLLQQLCSRSDVFVVDLDNPFGNIGCVVMASGLGKRFGGNKLMADFGGKPLINSILVATEDVFDDRVVVTKHKDIEKLCAEKGIKAILHNLPHRSDTIRFGVESVYGVDGIMFVPCDQPLLKKETVIALALAFKNDSTSIWRIACGETHGMPVIFPDWSFDELLKLENSQGGANVIKEHTESLRTLKIKDEYELKDVDTTDDLIELLKLSDNKT